VARVLSDLAAQYLRRVQIEGVMAHLTRLTEHDRYQASVGIERAADLIATAAEAIGLADVTVERFTADGATQWWTFQAPRAWTPTTARLDIRAAGQCIVAVDHATQPFTIATYSAPTPSGGLIARVAGVRASDLAGAVVVIAATDFARPDLLGTLAARGALGFITDGPCRGPSGEHPGRIELDARTALFGFSVTTSQRRAIEAAGAGAEAHIRVDIDRSASMPVVTGVLPGGGTGEVWLTSHLCHPRPGANDNASGAAALLGVAEALADRRSETKRDFDRRPRPVLRVGFDRSIRFVWGPEFLGVAALLHQRSSRIGRVGRPLAVINLDMVGEDPAQCGVPLVVERAPDWCASVITPLAEHVVGEVFAQTSAHVGTWRPGPFLGYSDHALFVNFVDPDWRSPAVQLWHPGDPFNHSAADTPDKVSAIEMLRATAAGAVLAEVLASDAACSQAVLSDVVQRWCDGEKAETDAAAERYNDVDHGEWSRRVVAHVREQCAVLRALVDDGPAASGRRRDPAKRAFVGRWPGPFNYRALLAELTAATRADVIALFGADKRNYAVLTHLAMLADGYGSVDEVIDAASLALRAPVDKAAAARLWSALLESAWIEETPDGQR
jgi:hypothetical protein